MKFNGQLLALCVCGTSAFTHQPLTHTFRLKTQSALSSVAGTQQYSFAPAAPATTSRAKSDESQNLSKAGPSRPTKSVWDDLSPITVQGNSLRTWSLVDPFVERVQVFMKTDGRPLNANVELWEGPDNDPQKMSVYLEDGNARTFSAIIETPSDGSNTIAIRNTGHLEFPLSACVEAEVDDDVVRSLFSGSGESKIVQGGAIYTTPFAPSVASVHVFLKTDGRPLNARLELLQGPNNNKQVIEYYSEDGKLRPLNMVIETPGVGNVVRIVNTATVEFPLTASVKPLIVDSSVSNGTGMGSRPFILS